MASLESKRGTRTSQVICLLLLLTCLFNLLARLLKLIHSHVLLFYDHYSRTPGQPFPLLFSCLYIYICGQYKDRMGQRAQKVDKIQSSHIES